MNGDQDYVQFITSAAEQDAIFKEDIEFIASYFEKPFNEVMIDYLEKKTLMVLAYNGTQYLN